MRLSTICLATVCTLVGSRAAAAETPSVKLLKPCVAVSGSDSHVTQRRHQRITSVNDWALLWQEHKGQKTTDRYDFRDDPLTLPLIDFDHYMVIAIFQGRGWNSAGLSCVSIAEEEHRIVFRFDDKSYQTFGPEGGGRPVKVYGFFVMPRSEKQLVLEENVQRYLGEQPVWKERISFPKLR